MRAWPLALWMAGVWGEPSPRIPPEARPNLGRSGDPTKWGVASQPWAEGAREGRRRLFTSPARRTDPHGGTAARRQELLLCISRMLNSGRSRRRFGRAGIRLFAARRRSRAIDSGRGMPHPIPISPAPLAPKGRDRALSRVLTAVERVGEALQPLPAVPLTPRRLVALKSCCLGDALEATPLLGALRRAYPEARLVAGVGRWSRPALLNNPDLDGLLDLEDVGIGRPDPGAYARVVRRLRAGRFDLALALDRTPLLTTLPLLAGIPVRAGIDSAGRGFALNVRVPWAVVEQEAALFLRVGRALGVSTDDARLRFVPVADDVATVGRLWGEAGLEGARAVALAPGGGQNPGMTLQAKRWPPARYAALADRLHEEHGLRVVLAGSQDDAAVAAEVRRLARAPVTNLAGRTTSFGALGALFARCVLFVGNDSGPMHLAAAVGTPVVAVFGPTDPAVYAPYSARVATLRGPRGESTEEVGVDEVAAAAAQLLARA